MESKKKTQSPGVGKKTDRRTQYTKMVIRDAFIQLLAEKQAVEKITVSEICRLAEINRGTFYLHYSDVYAVQEELDQEYGDKMIDYVDHAMRDDHHYSKMEILLNLDAQQDETLKVLFSEHFSAARILDRVIPEIIQILLPEMMKRRKCTEEQAFWLLAFLAGGYNALSIYLSRNEISSAKIDDLTATIREALQKGFE